jgi:tricorn protease
MKKMTFILAMALAGQITFGQISAKLMRYMDVSDSHITFVYGGDIWVTSKEGGTAIQLTHPEKNHGPDFLPMEVP